MSVPVASQELSAVEQSFLELFQAVFIVEGAFDGVTEDFVGFG